MHILTTYTHALVIKMLGCFDLKVIAKKLFANYLKRCIIVDCMYDVESGIDTIKYHTYTLP